MTSFPTAPVALAECPTLTPERQLLWDAANYMETHGKTLGWTAGGFDDSGRVCAIVAINSAAGDEWRFSDPAQEALLAFLGRDTLSDWSDENDQATIVQAMRDAAVSA